MGISTTFERSQNTSIIPRACLLAFVRRRYRFTELMDNGYPRFPVFVAPRDDFDWAAYCASYSKASKSTFSAGALQREHSIM